MSFKIFRRGSARCIGLLSAFITILLCLYYISIGQPSPQTKEIHSQRLIDRSFNSQFQNIFESGFKLNKENNQKSPIEDSIITNSQWDTCVILEDTQTDITTHSEFGKFDFQLHFMFCYAAGLTDNNRCVNEKLKTPTKIDFFHNLIKSPEWMKSKEYWDKTFETRYTDQNKDESRPPLKVVLVPHSHNDPGWLKTFVNYFQSDSREILNLIVMKLQEYKEMTFIWSEISILQLWWDQAHPTKQRALKQLVQSGRLEITTGGWVMTDEANVHYYAMVDQLIEGHQWVKNNLNYTPTVGWSIDPFGHGGTLPYLLAASDFEGTIIQRIHYAWKKWFAKQQAGDFIWSPYWTNSKTIGDSTKRHSLLTHNMPFDIYSIKHSCGPHPFICLNFDFRKIPGEYTEYSIKAQFITDENVKAKADLLLEQYSRTASLFPHNVALIPIGDDFRYNKEKEFEQQFTNYKKLIDYINTHKDLYKTEISFGTPKDYFKAIKERYDKFPTLKGDFFAYSDIFTEGRPAYWTGYFSTRPSYKLLSRELEHNLRNLDILFTFAFNLAHQQKHSNALRIFEKNYEKLILARRNLGLFQHHDAITGTSKQLVMKDYAIRMFESIQDSVKMQESAIEVLSQNNKNEHGFILSELERESYTKLARKTPIVVKKDKSVDFIVFNSLAQERLEVVLIRTTTPKVRILNPNGQVMNIQINPVWNITDSSEIVNRKIVVSNNEFEIMFLAKLSGLSLTTFTVEYNEDYKSKMSTLYCNDCKDEKSDLFEVRNKQPGDIQLENYEMRLLFDETTGFLRSVTKKNMGKPIQCAIKFGAYRSAQFKSGAYLFKTDPDHSEAEKDVLEQYTDFKILISSGPIASDVTAIYGPFLAHTVRIYNTKTEIDKAIYIENDIDFEPPPKNRETELYLRFVTDIENGENPEIYTDQSGFQYQHRIKVPSIGIEGNYFPITSGAFIQDKNLRLTLLTTHAQGAASLEPGQLEVMVDRRTLYDDYRGMGEGVVDSRLTRHKFWISFEKMTDNKNDNNEYQLPSMLMNQLSNSLNYPANIYYIEKSRDDLVLDLNKNLTLIKHQFPCDVHLVGLRTLTEEFLPLFPSRSALLLLHRQGYNCKMESNICNGSNNFQNNLFNLININSIDSTSLTGMNSKGKVDSFSDIYLDPMEIRTFNLTFIK